MRILALAEPSAATTWMDNTQAINGTFRSLDGRLLCAQGNTRRIVSYRIGAAGPEDAVVLAQNAAWKPPNDLCQSPAGDIYFTSPDFDTRSSGRVYRIAPGGAVTPVISDMPVPNGIITSLDGRTLYVSDSHFRHWKSYPILADGSVGSGSVFFNPVTSDAREPDGMTIDEFGDLFFCGRGGVWMVSPSGQQLGMIPFAEFCSNVTFGGIDGHTLYVTCDQKVYALDMQVRGAAWRGMPDTNAPPRVDAGPDRILATPDRVTTLAGRIADDGLPSPAALTSKWTLVSSPASPLIADPAAAHTQISFSQRGIYRLRLWAFDGSRHAIDEATIVVARPADFDGDDDVDTADANIFAACLGAPGQNPATSACQDMDLDTDGDVDNSDFGLVQRCYSGPFLPSDEHCAD
jgi:gluconolactonase